MTALSMATSTVTSPSSLSKLSFTQPPLSIPTTHLLSKPYYIPKHVKPLHLVNNTQFKNNPISLLSLSYSGIALSTEFDGFEVSQDDPQSETEEFEQQEEVEEGEGEGEGDEDEVKQTDSSDDGRLYVGNLPYSITSSELSEVFQEAGRVVNCEVIYDRVTDRSRGFGFVTMATVEEAKEAIRLFNGTQIGGRTVRVNFPEVPKGGEREVIGMRIRSAYKGFIDSPHKIYAGNLGWGLTSQGLRDAFAGQPGLLSAKVICERDTGRSRGFGFVSFETAENAHAALDAMNGVEVEGRPLQLNMASDRARSPPIDSSSESKAESSKLLSSIGA